MESVLDLPPRAELLASSALDPHQAVRLADRQVWGLQFHPGFSAAVIRSFIEAKRDDMRVEGLDPDRRLGEVRTTPWGDAILARFAQVVDDDSARASPVPRA